MILLISPSKTQDFQAPDYSGTFSQPAMLAESALLMQALARLQAHEISKLMDVSEKIASLNVARFSHFELPFSPDNAKAALFAFKGDVYHGFSLPTYTEEDFAFAQQHLRILSGLYGALRPLDLIQPYRLEMKTKLRNARGNDLYQFWGDRITSRLAADLAAQSDAVLINLASEEYFKAVQPKHLPGIRIVTPVFKEKKGDGHKIISFFAKQARGLMANYALLHRLHAPESLKDFREAGYSFHQGFSTEHEWVFTRG